MQDESTALPDVNDRAHRRRVCDELRTRDRGRKLIRKIDSRLRRLKRLWFLETCGIEIGLRRLEARPTATLCMIAKLWQKSKKSKTTDNFDIVFRHEAFKSALAKRQSDALLNRRSYRSDVLPSQPALCILGPCLPRWQAIVMPCQSWQMAGSIEDTDIPRIYPIVKPTFSPVLMHFSLNLMPKSFFKRSFRAL